MATIEPRTKSAKSATGGAARDDIEAARPDDGAKGRGRSAKGVLTIAGTLLFLLSLGYVAKFASDNWPSIARSIELDPKALTAAALFYALTHLSSSAAWMTGLRAMGNPLPFSAGLRISLVAQIAKYLPGNIAHYFARAGLAKPLGVRLTSSGVSGYAVPGAPAGVVLNGRAVSPGQVVHLDRGFHIASVPGARAARLIWGNGIRPPARPDEDGPLFMPF